MFASIMEKKLPIHILLKLIIAKPNTLKCYLMKW